MDIERIRDFIMVAETMSFTKAADELYKSQSVLSRQIKNFEEELGVQLFNRTTKAVSLTQEGEAFYYGFRKVLDQYEETINRGLSIKAGFQGELRIGVPIGQSLGENYRAFLRGFKEKYPKVFLNVRADNLHTLRTMFIENKLDIILARKSDFGSEIGAKGIEIGRTKIVLAVSKQHPVLQAGKKELKLSDFADDWFLAHPYRETPTNRRVIEQRCREAGFVPRIRMMPNLGSINVWVEANWGVAVLNENHSLRENRSICFIDIFDDWDADESVIYLPDRISACEKLFLAHAEDYVEKTNTTWKIKNEADI